MRASVLALLLVLAGCSSIPSDGPVTKVADGQVSARGATRYEPAKPRAGATRRQVVEGYLDSMLAHPVATGIVRAYLTPRAAKQWDSDAGMTVYSRVRTSVGPSVVLTVDERMALGRTVGHRCSVAPPGTNWRCAASMASGVSTRLSMDIS